MLRLFCINRKRGTSLRGQILYDFIVEELENMKARDIQVINVKGRSNVTDCMIVCSGNSNRHVSAIAENLMLELKQNGLDCL